MTCWFYNQSVKSLWLIFCWKTFLKIVVNWQLGCGTLPSSPCQVVTDFIFARCCCADPTAPLGVFCMDFSISQTTSHPYVSSYIFYWSGCTLRKLFLGFLDLLDDFAPLGVFAQFSCWSGCTLRRLLLGFLCLLDDFATLGVFAQFLCWSSCILRWLLLGFLCLLNDFRPLSVFA